MLPSDLRRQVEAALLARPDIPWDLATADIAQRIACAVDLPTINNRGETRHG
jgi:hypothetical protein